MTDNTLRFTAVGHYDVKGVGPCVAKVVAAFIDDASAVAFIKQVNDAQGADELELYVDGIPATEQHERAKAAVILYPAHRNDELHIRALKVLGEKVGDEMLVRSLEHRSWDKLGGLPWVKASPRRADGSWGTKVVHLFEGYKLKV